MRKALFFVACTLAACDSVTAPSHVSPDRARATTVYGYVTSISVPDTINADESGYCDIPVTMTNWSSTDAVIDSGSITAGYHKYERNSAAFRALLGTFAPGTQTAVIPDASLTPGHSPAPYPGRVVVKITDSGYAYGYYAEVLFFCKASHGTSPGYGSGNPPAEPAGNG